MWGCLTCTCPRNKSVLCLPQNTEVTEHYAISWKAPNSSHWRVKFIHPEGMQGVKRLVLSDEGKFLSLEHLHKAPPEPPLTEPFPLLKSLFVPIQQQEFVVAMFLAYSSEALVCQLFWMISIPKNPWLLQYSQCAHPQELQVVQLLQCTLRLGFSRCDDVKWLIRPFLEMKPWGVVRHERLHPPFLAGGEAR